MVKNVNRSLLTSSELILNLKYLSVSFPDIWSAALSIRLDGTSPQMLMIRELSYCSSICLPESVMPIIVTVSYLSWVVLIGDATKSLIIAVSYISSLECPGS